ncbi:YgaP family membrane protein [Flavobacterium luminosum]|uniref:DUF2892 domain-containing protein n=1 Tax=Flavobacterium luminosum TaxID=2949086 RepID=A0ABT0TMX3_9FLAO|nr:DUF2892 domain-containing protein [Flavobacterium sp. HXWNR70]MCL9808439.1 DUF2892 domain-containing protein [Flavobacterium sp. HXWNR70]
MTKNMSAADRMIRILLAIIMGYLTYNGSITGTLGWILTVLAGVFVITSFIGFCPLYKVFGFSTCPTTPNKP